MFVPIVNYEGLYSINSDGQIFSHKRNKILKPIKRKDKYLVCCLYKNRQAKTLRIHRLVLLAFIGYPPKYKLDCNHKNGIRSDNRVSNLEWCSRSENIKHSYRVLNRQPTKNHGINSKVTEKDVLQIRRLYVTGRYTQKQLGQTFNIDRTQISNIILRKCWKYL